MCFIILTKILANGEETDFEALNFLPALNLIRSTKLHLRTEPAFFQTPIGSWAFSQGLPFWVCYCHLFLIFEIN